MHELYFHKGNPIFIYGDAYYRRQRLPGGVAGVGAAKGECLAVSLMGMLGRVRGQ